MQHHQLYAQRLPCVFPLEWRDCENQCHRHTHIALAYDDISRRTTVTLGNGVTTSGYAASLDYDAEGRLRKTTLGGTATELLYDGVDLVAEYDGAGALLRKYVHGPGIDEPLAVIEGSTKTWLYADHQGSVVGQANASGTNTAIYSYGPFGEPDATTGVRFRYTGQQYIGALNLYYYKARFYSPTLGRFLQTDPVGVVDDLNLYAYVGNNPVNFSDPLGLEVKVVTSDPRAAKILMEAYARLNTTKTGRALTGPLEKSPTVYTIRVVTKNAYYCTVCGSYSNAVYMDPYNNPVLPITAGMQPISKAATLGHELGHATGMRDDGPGEMNNVLKYENPIRRELGEPEKTAYSVSVINWVPGTNISDATTWLPGMK
ncbi:MAG: hypothetical protein LBF61_08060 [Azoarcus sp.]|jgi:RHS repeat-associated protein|nr:hypothetical protein [Azoarcus sp.]